MLNCVDLKYNRCISINSEKDENRYDGNADLIMIFNVERDFNDERWNMFLLQVADRCWLFYFYLLIIYLLEKVATMQKKKAMTNTQELEGKCMKRGRQRTRKREGCKKKMMMIIMKMGEERSIF